MIDKPCLGCEPFDRAPATWAHSNGKYVAHYCDDHINTDAAGKQWRVDNG